MDYTETINTTIHFREGVTVANKAETGKDANEAVVGCFGSAQGDDPVLHKGGADSQAVQDPRQYGLLQRFAPERDPAHQGTPGEALPAPFGHQAGGARGKRGLERRRDPGPHRNRRQALPEPRGKPRSEARDCETVAPVELQIQVAMVAVIPEHELPRVQGRSSALQR